MRPMDDQPYNTTAAVRLDPPLTPSQAFRAILRATYPQWPTLGDEITNARWFHFPDLTGASREYWLAATEATRTLYEAVHHGKIQLRGEAPGDRFPRDIDPDHAMRGGLDIWAGTLEVAHENGITSIYQNVRCVGGDVRAIVEHDTEIAIQYKTGAPGRPTAMHLVEKHHAERCERKEAMSTISAEADYLANWLRTAHPTAPKLYSKTISNRLATAHRKYLKNAQN
jgi:hypothetical protein